MAGDGDLGITAATRFGMFSGARVDSLLMSASVPPACDDDGRDDEPDVDPENALHPAFVHVEECLRGLLRDGVFDAELMAVSTSSAGEGI